LLECISNVNCQSSNYKTTVAADQNNCDLNSQTRLSSPVNYVTDAGTVHYYDYTLEVYFTYGTLTFTFSLEVASSVATGSLCCGVAVVHKEEQD